MEQSAKWYLESNAIGREDGSRKAQMHQLLCLKFTMEYFDLSKNVVERLFYNNESLTSQIRKSTLPLTDCLDEVIGFPLDKAPNYRKLVPLFLTKFKELAIQWIQDEVVLLNVVETETLLKELCHSRLGMVLRALESYGYKFIEGGDEGKWFIAESPLGVKVKIKENIYFGCSYELGGLS